MRLRYVTVTVGLFVEAMKHGISAVDVIENALPEDARLVRYGFDDIGRINLIIESAEFDELDEGAVVPSHPQPVFRKREPISTLTLQ